MGKKRRKTLRMLKNAFKTAGASKIITGYIITFFLAAVPIWLFEPNIKTYTDSLWFCFASATSIGYGDISAVTHVGRIITVILSIYSIGVIAIFTAVVTSFFMDVAQFRAKESARKFLDDLEHLPELSREELEQISKRVKEFKGKE